MVTKKKVCHWHTFFLSPFLAPLHTATMSCMYHYAAASLAHKGTYMPLMAVFHLLKHNTTYRSAAGPHTGRLPHFPTLCRWYRLHCFVVSVSASKILPFIKLYYRLCIFACFITFYRLNCTKIITYVFCNLSL